MRNLYPAAACAARSYGQHDLIAKKKCRRPYRDTDGEMERQADRNLILTGPHWGPLDPSVEINSSRLWNPTL